MNPLRETLPKALLAVVFFVGMTYSASAQPTDTASGGVSSTVVLPLPPTQITAEDAPDDAGDAVDVAWSPSPDEKKNLVHGYRVFRANGTEGEFVQIAVLPVGVYRFTDPAAPSGVEFSYRVSAVHDGNVGDPGPTVKAISSAQWFNTGRLNMLIAVVIFFSGIIYWIRHARTGRELYVRKIAGLEAIDDAVGRATEMGRKIIFIPGIMDLDDVQTIAGLTILGRIAETTAQYDTPLEVPVSRSMVMTTGREIVRESYTRAGRPDAYNDQMVHYLTDDQFGYAAGVDGIIVRDKPATLFFLGTFYAESLILAETGNSVGAIQIAGTAMPSQLPFFITACDYTLIGEELFAASAYLSPEPMLRGSIKGQDVGKAIIMVALIATVILATVGTLAGIEWMQTIGDLFRVQ